MLNSFISKIKLLFWKISFKNQAKSLGYQDQFDLISKYLVITTTIVYQGSNDSLITEWILPSKRLALFFEKDQSDSGWAFVSKDITCCGTLDNFSEGIGLLYERN